MTAAGPAFVQSLNSRPGGEFVNAAMTGINSHVIREIARDCAPHDGDFWLVYASNNEVIGPFGAGTIFGRRAPDLIAVRTTLALKATRVGQLLGQLTRSASQTQGMARPGILPQVAGGAR